MTLHQNLSESKLIKDDNGVIRRVCSECVVHFDTSMPHEFYDCKNVFYDDDRNVAGQCMCYSKEHGIRERI